MPTLRHALLAALIGLATGPLASPPPAAADPSLPESVAIDGQELVLNGYETRETLFVALYTVALYVPETMASVERIDDPEVPKAFRVEVVYDGSMPDEIPEDWREELLPALTAEQTEVLRRASAALDQGDVIRIAYAPVSGTAVELNGETVLQDPSHEPMAACVSLWLGPDPVSEDIRRALLSGGV